jgi:hypothetical protein
MDQNLEPAGIMWDMPTPYFASCELLFRLLILFHSGPKSNLLQLLLWISLERNPSVQKQLVLLRRNRVVPKMQPIVLMTSVGTDNSWYRFVFSEFLAEFAFEIGSGLLTEVRRLQSLLAERDKAIQDMKEEKDDLEKSVESLRTALRQQEQSAGACVPTMSGYPVH